MTLMKHIQTHWLMDTHTHRLTYRQIDTQTQRLIDTHTNTQINATDDDQTLRLERIDTDHTCAICKHAHMDSHRQMLTLLDNKLKSDHNF